MAVRGLTLDWKKKSVICAECGSNLLRRIYHPKTGKRISRFFCNHSCKGLWQKRQKPVDETWLREKYLSEGMDCPQIAAIVGRDPKSVWNWLKGYGIPTRPRGSHDNIRKGREPGFTQPEHVKEAIRQARLADGHFPKNPDGSAYWKGRTGEQHPAWKGGKTPLRQKFYYSKEWKKACRIVWHRADAKCERCGLDHRKIDRSKKKFHIHHVIPFFVERRRADPANLVLLCDECHLFVHSKANGDREFLPAFGFVVADDGSLMPASYRPSLKGKLPTWLQSK